METVLAPGLLQNSGTIQVVAHDDERDHLLAVLQALKPRANFQAYNGTASDLVLTTEPDVGIEGARVLPLPVGDPWGWWEWSKRAAENSEGLAEGFSADLPLPPNTGGVGNGRERDFPAFALRAAPHSLTRKIESVMERLDDEASRECYRSVLFGMPEELAERYHNRLFSTLQYTDYVRLPPDAVIVNGGVHDGSEIAVFSAMCGGEPQLHNIDPGGFAYLSAYAGRWVGALGKRCQRVALALADKDGRAELALCDDGQMSSRFSQGDGLSDRLKFFPAMTLDSYVRSRSLQRLDLIKLDLEGAEETVVPSMLPLVHRLRPQLAVSIYHKLEHFWSIPELLMNALEGYQFYMGHYSSQGYETILYAIPEERT